MDSPAISLLLNTVSEKKVQHIAWMNALPDPALVPLMQTKDICLQQTFKPYVLGLQALQCQPAAELNGNYEVVLLIPSKDKTQTLGWMAQAFEHLKADGVLMMACENQYGAKSYESALKKLAGQVASTSKSKCRLFSAKKTVNLNTELQQQWLDAAKPQILESHGLWAQPGLFSWKKADIGSLMLLEHLPQLSGKVMDLCCGYGLLAANMLKNNTGIKELHLVEAESLALACAKKNMQGFEGAVYHHLDAAKELLPKHLNAVVCNPPFHTGQSRDVELGQNIVKKACGALTHGGELYLVANRQLPYEKILQEYLRSVEILAQANGFKVIKGKK